MLSMVTANNAEDKRFLVAKHHKKWMEVGNLHPSNKRKNVTFMTGKVSVCLETGGHSMRN